MSKEEMQKVIEAFKCGWLTMSYDDNQIVDVRNEILKVIAEKDAEIAKRDALIKELADALNSYLAGECIDCGAKCEGDGACVHQKNLRTLVAKAREVTNERRV